MAAPLFDAYLMLDWSAANMPKRGRDSIWFCHLVRQGGALAVAALENPPTRHEAHRRLHDILEGGLAAHRSVLFGCDFPFGYAKGFAARLGVSGPPWRAIWDEIAGLLVDDERNVSNRFAVAAAFNRRISNGAFPFWGCPARQATPFLAMKHHYRHETEGLAERRLSDQRMRRLQPGWKLAGTGSAGSQALTGIPIVRRLRDNPHFADRAAVWPFETGLRPLGSGNGAARIIFAEVWPSLVPPLLRDGEVKDSAQVRTIAHHFAALDDDGALGQLFAGDPNLSATERASVEREEGWVLGITGVAVKNPHPPAARAAGSSLSRKRARGTPPSPACGRGPG